MKKMAWTLLILVFLLNMSSLAGEVSDMDQVEFVYVGESGYNPADLIDVFSIKENTPITYWKKIKGEAALLTCEKDMGFSFPAEVEFDDTATYLLSCGRRIRELYLFQFEDCDGSFLTALSMVYDMEHEGLRVFVYEIPDGKYALSGFKSPSYLYDGVEKVFIADNVVDMNEIEYDWLKE